MKKRQFTWTVVLVLLLAALPLAGAQSRYYEGVEWEPLFNGKDLTGWKTVWGGQWRVEDGVIVGESPSGEGGFCVTEKTYTDFEVHVRYKTDTPGNSAVFYHTRIEGEEFGGGMQVEIDPAVNRHTGGLYESRGRNWVAWPAPENETVMKLDDWNDLLIKVVRNRVTTRLNGVLMVDFTDPQPKYSEGVIGFQLHSSRAGGQKIRFKDIWIRDLSAR